MISGVTDAIQRLRGKFDTAKEFLKDELEKVGDELVNDAKNNAAGTAFVHKGEAISIADKIEGGLEGDEKYVLEVQAGEWGAYVEFGTGEFAKTLLQPRTSDWKRLAMNFYVNGKGKLPAHPYVFPAFFKMKSEAPDKFKKAIREGLK